MMTLILLKIFKEAIIKLNCIKELFWFNKFEFDLNLNKKYNKNNFYINNHIIIKINIINKILWKEYNFYILQILGKISLEIEYLRNKIHKLKQKIKIKTNTNRVGDQINKIGYKKKYRQNRTSLR